MRADYSHTIGLFPSLRLRQLNTKIALDRRLIFQATILGIHGDTPVSRTYKWRKYGDQFVAESCEFLAGADQFAGKTFKGYRIETRSLQKSVTRTQGMSVTQQKR